ncbi:MAG TPA: MFS transporter [Candidatus Obscuribacterales bacterium]
MANPAPTGRSSALEPLKSEAFRTVFFASFCMNTGLFIQDIGSAWLMTSLTTQPMMIALMQTAAVLPYFLLSLPAGAGADLVDRRKLLIAGQCWLILAAGALTLLTLTGHTQAWTLLCLTFVLYIGCAFNSPAWNVIIPQLVQRQHMESAIAMSSAGYNLARGFGAALGGLIVASFGSGWAFAVNTACFIYMLLTLISWSHKASRIEPSSEPMVSAIRAGLRYVKHSQVLKAVMVRTALYMLPVSVMWSLLPLLAREQLHVNSTQYGFIVAAFGIGTLLGAILLPKLRQRVTLDGASTTGIILFALSFGLLALSHTFWLGFLAMLGCGVGWAVKNNSLNVSVQLSAPNWVRARAYSVYLVVFQGCTAIGAVIWGAVASAFGMSMAFLIAAGLLLIGLIGNLFYKLSHADTMDVRYSSHWRMPELSHTVPAERDGPVLVTVEYIIDPDKAAEFLDAINDLEPQRRRDGAFQWHVFRDLEDASRFYETYMVETWGEHVRQHEHVLVSDKAAEQRVDAFHLGPDKPLVGHFIAAGAGKSLLINRPDGLPAHSHNHTSHETTEAQ